MKWWFRSRITNCPLSMLDSEDKDQTMLCRTPDSCVVNWPRSLRNASCAGRVQIIHVESGLVDDVLNLTELERSVDAVNKTPHTFATHENAFAYIGRAAQIRVVVEVTNSVFAAKRLQVIPQAVRRRKTRTCATMSSNIFWKICQREYCTLFQEGHDSMRNTPKSCHSAHSWTCRFQQQYPKDTQLIL